MRKPSLCAVLAAALAAAPGAGAQEPGTPEFYDGIIAKEAAFIADCQLPSGGVAMQSRPLEPYGGGYRIVPYFANLALEAMLELPEYAPAAKRYMDWYFARLNTALTDYNGIDATIYDYSVAADGVAETPQGRYDSTDSYPATFFSLMRKYVEASGDESYVIARAAELDELGRSMLGTYDRGLTYAKPDHRAQYLMDNSEVRRGLVDLVWLFGEVLDDPARAARYDARRAETEAAVETLWNAEAGWYAPYRDDRMARADADLAAFYPDAVAQLYPIWNGLLPADGQRARAVYAAFVKNFPGWPALRGAGDYPWAVVAYTAAVMGDKAKVDAYLRTVKERYIDRGHPHNWYVLEAGMTLLAAKTLRDQALSAASASVCPR